VRTREEEETWRYDDSCISGSLFRRNYKGIKISSSQLLNGRRQQRNETKRQEFIWKRSLAHNLGVRLCRFFLLSLSQLTNGKNRSIYHHNEVLLSSQESPHMSILSHACLPFPLPTPRLNKRKTGTPTPGIIQLPRIRPFLPLQISLFPSGRCIDPRSKGIPAA